MDIIVLDYHNEYNKKNYRNAEKYVSCTVTILGNKNKVICILSDRTPLEIALAIEENTFIEKIDRITKLELKEQIQVMYLNYNWEKFNKIIEKQNEIIESLEDRLIEFEKNKKKKII